MASIKWSKLNIDAVAKQAAHFDQEKRLAVEHANLDIDKSLTHLNYFLPATYVDCEKPKHEPSDEEKEPAPPEEKSMTFAIGIRKIRDRITEVDAAHPPRRNNGDKRITCVGLWLTCPAPIEAAGRADEFFEKVHETFVRFFGEENIGLSCVHKDEVHDYYDPIEQKYCSSLSHMHTYVVPYAEWTDKSQRTRVGVNGKAFVTRQRMLTLDTQIVSMIKKEFDLDYHTGNPIRDMSVERLKVQSLRTEADKLQNEVDRKQTELDLLTTPSRSLPPKRKWETEEKYKKRIQEEEMKMKLAIKFEQMKREQERQRTEFEFERMRLVGEIKAAEKERDKAVSAAKENDERTRTLLGKLIDAIRNFFPAEEKERWRKRYLARGTARRKEKQKRKTLGRSMAYGRAEKTED